MRTSRPHTPEHVEQITAILRDYPGARTDGFPEAVRDLCDRLDCDGITRPHFRPDAFRLNEEECEIEIFEVEVTHRIPRRKLADLGAWWEEWDGDGEHDWLPVLIVVDRFGGRTRVDLCRVYHDYTLARAGEEA